MIDSPKLIFGGLRLAAADSFHLPMLFRKMPRQVTTDETPRAGNPGFLHECLYLIIY
jgi:hypothetical protein